MLFYYSLLLTYFLKIAFDFNFVVYILSSFGVFLLLKHFLLPFFDVEISTILDALFSLETSENTCYIVSCLTFEEEIDIPTILIKLRQNIAKFPQFNKMKKHFNMKFGVCYWTKSSNFTLENHFEVINTVFENDEALYEFMAKHVNEIKFPKNIPKWKLFLLKNLPGNKSAFVMKISHGMVDGISLMNFLMTVGESKEFKVVDLPKLSKWRRILLYILGIFQIGIFLKTSSLKKPDDNCFNNAKSEKKNSFCSSQLDLKILKIYAKTLGVGLNDVVLSLLSMALQNYHLKKYNEDINEFSVFLAASLVPIRKANEVYPLHNNAILLSEKLYFIQKEEEFSTYVKRFHLNFKRSKSSTLIYLQQFFVEILYLFIPIEIPHNMVSKVSGTHSATFTSVPGPMTPVSIFGCQIENIFFFVGGPASMIFNILTYNEKLSLAGVADEACGLQCKELVEEFVKLFTDKISNKKTLDN